MSIEGLRVNASNYDQPINLGSDERISIADLAKMIILLSGKKVEIDFITGPTELKDVHPTILKSKVFWVGLLHNHCL